MGLRGPKPKDKKPFTPLQGFPEPPKNLDAHAKRKWRELAELMAEAGLVSLIDRDALAIFVVLFQRWEIAKGKVEASRAEGFGEVIRAPNGYMQKNPWYEIARESENSLTKYYDQFGMTPKARIKFEGIEEEPEMDNKWSEFDVR